MKRNVRRSLFFATILLAAGLIYMNFETIERWLYPIEYKQEIERYAAKYELSPLLVAAVMASESDYKPHLVSKKGAVGLMQLMPNTAQWAAVKMGNLPPTAAQLYDPQTNIEIGCWYLQNLRTQFGGNEIAMIAAYNAGPTNVRKWLNEGRWDGRMENSLDIPFGETRHYLQRVMFFRDKYERLYGE